MFTLQQQASAVIKTNLVHPRGRDTFWRFYFGTVPDWQRIEGDIFNMMAKCCQTYQGAFWEFSMLSNGGVFIWPDMLETSLQMFNPHNGNEAELSPEAAGIAVSSGHLKPKALCWWNIFTCCVITLYSIRSKLKSFAL